MELDASIEPTIGPYEVYEDEWFNFKAAFEAFITIRDEAESKKLQVFGAELQGLENALPIDPALRNPTLGALAPIKVVNVVFTAGDANRGVQTAAFNLPNDERVVKEKGTKRVMLKNVQEAKFKMALEPIAKVALPEAQQKNVSFDAFFTHILMHELMHGLGPHNISVGGRQTTVRQELKETYSAIEEAKADVSGLWALKQLADQGKVDKAIAQTMYTTFLASSFRSIRFGVNEAHGRGIAIQLNYFLDQGAFVVAADGRFTVDEAKMTAAVTSLTRDIMTLQAEGSYQKAKALIDTLGVVRPPGAAGARPPDGSASGHRTEVHHRCDAPVGGQTGVRPRSDPADPGPLPHNWHSDVGTIADDAVGAPTEQAHHVVAIVYRPDPYWQAGPVRVRDELRRDNQGRPRSLGHLKLAVFRATERPSHARAVQCPPRLFAGRAGRNAGLIATRRVQRAPVKRTEDDAIERARRADVVNRPVRQLRIRRLELDDDAGARVPLEHRAQPGNADLLSAEGIERRRGSRIGRESIAGIHLRELIRRAPRHRTVRARSCGRACRHDARRPRRRETDGRRVRDHRRRVPGRDRTPRSCSPAGAPRHLDGQRRAAGTFRGEKTQARPSS